MKRVICIFLVLLFAFSLVSCNKETANTSIMADSTLDELSTAVKYPVPKTVTFEESDNKLGARYTFTLKEFNSMLNEASKILSKTQEKDYFDYSLWQVVSENLTDDNGIKYSSYYYATDTLTLTAAVENTSGKVMNIGCGTTYSEFASADADYQYTVMLTAALVAMVAGGYSEDDLEFLYCVYFDAAKNNESFYYHNGVYMMNISKEAEKEGSALLFLASPIADSIISEWELTDYSDFEGSYK